MRTTLNIEEEALAYAKDRAKATGQSLGAVVSEVLKEAAKPQKAEIGISRSGFPLIRGINGGKKIDLKLVQEALDEEEIQKYNAPFRR